MNTLIQPVAAARRTRRRYRAEFKEHIAAACRQLGVSIAAVALANGPNANLVRRWVVEHEGAGGTVIMPSAPMSPQEVSPPSFSSRLPLYCFPRTISGSN